MKTNKRLFKAVLAALLVLCLSIPAMADTLSEIRLLNLESYSLEYRQPGSTTPMDYEDSSLSFNLKFNFPRLQTDTDTPKALREFVQHPSNILLDLSIGDEGYSTTGWEQDTDSQTLGIGGMYYTPMGDWATGIGLYITDTDGEGDSHPLGSLDNDLWSFTSSSKELRLQQYIKGFVRLGLNVSQAEYEEDGHNYLAATAWRYTTDMDGTAFNAEVNIRDKASIYLGVSDEDWTDSDLDSWTVSETEFRVGFYLGKSVAIFLGMISEDEESLLYKASTDLVYLAPEFYIGDHVDIKLGFASIDGSDNSNVTWEGDAFNASLGLKF